MNIVVMIKQVPETGNVKMDPDTGTMVRAGVQSIINPLDLYAVELAIQLKENHGGEITVLTMGPPSAEKSLREAVAMGCDRGILLSGKEFAGSDTWATSNVLAAAIKELDSYDLVLAGERATDGDTGQVGPGVASFLNLPLATYTSKLIEVQDKHIVVERLIEEGYEKLRLPLPALLTVVKEVSFPRLPTLRGKQKARSVEIPVLSGDELNLDKQQLGLGGSPTRVVKIERPRVSREGKIIKIVDEQSREQAVEELVHYLKENELI